jgi:triphosphoribosyl-dephospho-CoA synthase
MTAARWQAIRHLPDSVADDVAVAAATALLEELETWPKPGLVSHVDAGSHTDMDAGTFRASVAAITPFFARLTLAGAAGSGMDGLRRIGIEAERAMFEKTGGANTHRGAIFGLGLLCAAAGATWSDAATQPLRGANTLGAAVRRRWGAAIMRGPIPLRSHGTDALRRFGAGGARAEAAAGFPHALEVGLPALRLGRAITPGDPEAARVQSFFALLESTEDTNLLHRGGIDGLRFAQEQADAFLRQGGIKQAQWRKRAAAMHRAFIARRLSPGGCADLLAITLLFDALGTRSWVA